MKSLQFFFRAFVVEALGVVLVVCMLDVSPSDYFSTRPDSQTKSSWFENESRNINVETDSAARTAYVENMFESSANRLYALISRHADRFISETWIP